MNLVDMPRSIAIVCVFCSLIGYGMALLPCLQPDPYLLSMAATSLFTYSMSFQLFKTRPQDIFGFLLLFAPVAIAIATPIFTKMEHDNCEFISKAATVYINESARFYSITLMVTVFADIY